MKFEAKEKFLELRARGMSFAQISAQIGVSKTTLIKWNREMAHALARLHSLHQAALLEKYQKMELVRFSVFANTLNAAVKELKTRHFSEMPLPELLICIKRLSKS